MVGYGFGCVFYIAVDNRGCDKREIFNANFIAVFGKGFDRLLNKGYLVEGYSRVHVIRGFLFLY